MTTLQSMVSNLTLPYHQGAYVQEIELGHYTDDGLTPIPDYGLDDYAVRHGVAPWDLKPVYLVAPRFDLRDEYVCLSFDVLGWPENQPKPQVRIPSLTPAWTPFIIPLGEDVTGLTRLMALQEYPVPADEAPLGRERWQILALVGNMGRLLWVMGWERARLTAIGREVGTQRQLVTAHGYSLDLIGQELRVSRLFPSPYAVDPAAIALYHLDYMSDDEYDNTTVGDRVIDATGRYHGQNQGAKRGVPGRFNRGFEFRSGDLPHPRCEAEYEFQQRLRYGNWDVQAGERAVRSGPYCRYGYREGAINVTGPDGQPHAVWVNDEAENSAARGQLTSACYGFVPQDLEKTIERFKARGRTIQAAIDYFGEWWGRPEAWFKVTYDKYKIQAPHERCGLPEAPLTYVRIPNRSAFDIPAAQSFTVEAFIRPVPTEESRLRIIAIKSHEVFYGGLLPVHCVEGWALSMGTFNCIPNNVAWSISDLPDGDEAEHGRRIVTVTADLNLDDGQWHHIAGVIDRRYHIARLYVDGVERGCQDIREVGEIINQEDILLGINDYHFDAPYDGLIDEVRLSNVARHSFHPVLGESDERYRTCLSIYRPWLIPTYDNIRYGLQRLLQTSPYGPEVSAPTLPEIEVIERDNLRVCTERLLKIRPLALPPGGHIDLEGDRKKSEAEACGPRDENFFEWQLVKHENSAEVTYATSNAKRMQLAAARSLDNLVNLLQNWQGKSNKLQVLAAFMPGGDALQTVGRALHLNLEGMPPGVLAAFAHKACFDYVEYINDETDGFVHALVREELEKLEIAAGSEVGRQQFVGRNDLIRIKIGEEINFTVARPLVPDKRYFNWLLIECGPGQGKLQTIEGDNASHKFIAKAPGKVIVKVEFRWQGITISGRREVKIGLQSLPPCESIGSDGALGVSEVEAAGKPEGFFHEALLGEHNNPQVDYGSNPNNHRMQLSMEKAFIQLLKLITLEAGVAGKLQILTGYNPNANDLARVGRKLKLAHEDKEHMPLGRLAALAHDAGFTWVYHPPYPEGIFVAKEPESPLEIIPGPIEHLPPNAVVNWLGIMRADAPEALPSTAVPTLATAPNDSRVIYDTADSQKMTQATLDALIKLLPLLDKELQANQVTGKLHIIGAFDNTATNLRRNGAALEMRHESVSLERLGALAHQAGFDYIKHVTVPSPDPNTHYIYASVWREDDNLSGRVLPNSNFAEIIDYGLLNASDYSEVAEEGVRQLCLRPDVLAWMPPVATDPDQCEEEKSPIYLAPLPEVAHYYWCLTRYGPGRGRLDSPPEKNCKLVTAERAGVVGARGEFVLGDATEPYSFELAVKPDAQGYVPPIPKLVYDDLMNFLEFHHPVGVEGRTEAVRKHVLELMADKFLRNANTERTYPRYRQRRARTEQIIVSKAEINEAPCACSCTGQGNKNLEEKNQYA